MRLLRQYIRSVLVEVGRHDDSSQKEDEDEKLLLEPDENENRDDSSTDEFSGVGSIAGYTLPLGASNHPSTLRQRGKTAGQGFGGAKPVKKKPKK